MDYADVYPKIRSKVTTYLSKFNTEISVDELLKQILSTEKKRTGLELKTVSNLPGIDGQYSSIQNTILVNGDVTYKPRVFFTIFHELMHYFLENLFEDEYSSFLEYSYSLSKEKQKQELENLCNYGAGVFLVPDSKLKLSSSTIFKGEDFKDLVLNQDILSLPAFICRLSFEVTSPAILLLLKNGSIYKNYDINLFASEESKIAKGTYIEYAFNTQSHEYPLKRFKLLNSDHLLSIDSFINQETYHTIDECYIPYSRTTKRIPGWVTGFHLPESSRYVGIMHTRKPYLVSEEQQTLFDM